MSPCIHKPKEQRVTRHKVSNGSVQVGWKRESLSGTNWLSNWLVCPTAGMMMGQGKQANRPCELFFRHCLEIDPALRRPGRFDREVNRPGRLPRCLGILYLFWPCLKVGEAGVGLFVMQRTHSLSMYDLWSGTCFSPESNYSENQGGQ